MSCEPGALNDDFDEETFVEDDGNGDGTHMICLDCFTNAGNLQ
jgi:hypothetical protein